MFTGLVAAVGRIVSVKPLSGEDAGVRLSIDAGDLGLEDVAIGDSIAVQGACMTVIGLSARGFRAKARSISRNPWAWATSWAGTSCPAMWTAWARSCGFPMWANRANW